MKTFFRFNSLFGKAVLAAAFCLCAFTPAQAARTQSSIIIDAYSGKVLSASNADELRYPASLTKLMTLYITFGELESGRLKMTDKLKVSRTAANRSPSKLGLKPGSYITVHDAVMALIVKSANDCATVLAEGIGYSEENFANTMTKVARELGMKDTTFKNASGLPNRAQKTTARDMAVLGAAMYHHYPQYYKLFSAKSFTWQGRKMYTHNHLLKTFKGADGMKTGFTNAAGYNIVTSAEQNGNRVIAVTMGHDTLRQRDRKVASLMTRGLHKLALADNIEKPVLYADVDASASAETAEIARTADETSADKARWGVQVGAFSNYAKARNYALQIRRGLNSNYIKKARIDIEAAAKGAAVVYRSKLVGLEKNQADKTCNRLKKENKSCIVIASNPIQQLAMAEQQ